MKLIFTQAKVNYQLSEIPYVSGLPIPGIGDIAQVPSRADEDITVFVTIQGRNFIYDSNGDLEAVQFFCMEQQPAKQSSS